MKRLIERYARKAGLASPHPARDASGTEYPNPARDRAAEPPSRIASGRDDLGDLPVPGPQPGPAPV